MTSTIGQENLRSLLSQKSLDIEEKNEDVASYCKLYKHICAKNVMRHLI